MRSDWSNPAPLSTTHADSVNTPSVAATAESGNRSTCCSRTAIASEAGKHANRKNRGPQNHPPNQAHQLAYTRIIPARNHSQSRCTPLSSSCIHSRDGNNKPGTKNRSPLPNDSNTDSNPKNRG